MSKNEAGEDRAVTARDIDVEQAAPVERITVEPKGTSTSADASLPSSRGHGHGHGPVEMVGVPSSEQQPIQTTVAELEAKKGGRFSYLKRRQFWLVFALSQALAVTITGTNTLTSLLNGELGRNEPEGGVSIPAFQSLFNYILLTLIYTSFTIYKYGITGWLKLLKTDGWRYVILSFFDVLGNYFTVLAYQYTTILSAQLISFWAIAVVVAISLIFLKVRYHVLQYIGILICCGGLGMLVASDHIQGSNGGRETVKGDMFALVGATFYGLTNVFEEFLVSKRPMYEVIGQLGFFGMFISGVIAAIFDRENFQKAAWSADAGGYLAGYTLLLSWFYSAVPVVLRMASAAFFNIGLLTGNFWGLLVGIRLFGLTVHWMYPVAFVLILIGHFVYYGTEGVLGEAKKPWLGENQEGGSDGIGTARRQLEHPGVTL